MDLSKFDLSEEVTAAIQAEVAKETEGLRNKMSSYSVKRKQFKAQLQSRRRLQKMHDKQPLKQKRPDLRPLMTWMA